MDLNAPKAQRSRISRGRSRTGCKTCRTRHVKCDEARPVCRSCKTLERKCVWTSDKDPSTLQMDASGFSVAATILSYTHTHVEARLFNQYMTVAAPYMGNDQSPPFWQEIIPSLSYGNEHIYQAIIALTALSPFQQRGAASEKMSRETFEQGLRYYNASVRKSIEVKNTYSTIISDIGNVSLTLAAMILYIFIELRLGQLDNIEKLARIAFRFIKDHEPTIVDSKDAIVLCCLYIITTDLLQICIDPPKIPKPERDTAMSLTLKLACRLGWSELQLLRIEVSELMCGIVDFSNHPDASSCDLDYRMNDWYRRMINCSSTAFHPVHDPAALKLIFSYRQTRVQWIFLNESANRDPALKNSVSELLDTATKIAATCGTTSTVSDWVLFGVLYPSCLFSAWYARDADFLPRMKSLLTRYAQHDELRMQRILRYIEELITSPGDPGTERLMVDGDTRLLQLRHCSVFAVAMDEGRTT